MNDTSRLNYKKTFILGFGFFAISLIWQIYNYYVPLFLHDFLPGELTKINGVMTLDNLLAVTLIPFIGSLSDRTNTRFGRRMPFLLIGMPLSALFFLFVPYFSKLYNPNLPLFLIIIGGLLVSMAIYRSPTIALMPDITPHEHQSKANGIINFMGGIGTIFALLVGAILYKMNPNYPFIMTSVLVLFSLFMVFKFIKEPINSSVSAKDAEEPVEMRSTIKAIIENKDKTALFILLGIFFWFVAYHGVVATFSNYCVHFLNIDSADGAFFLSIMSLSFVIMAIPSGYIAAKLKKKNVILIGIAGMFISFMLLSLLRPSMTIIPFKIAMILVMAFAGVSWAFININSYPLVVELAGKTAIGTYTGFYYFSSQIAAILGPLLLGIFIDISGFKLMFPIAAFSFLIAFFFIWRSKPKK